MIFGSVLGFPLPLGLNLELRERDEAERRNEGTLWRMKRPRDLLPEKR